MYLFVALMRRTLLILVLVGFNYTDPLNLVIGMLVVQIPYTVLIIVLRPFEEQSDNIIEIANEAFYTVIIAWLVYFDSKSKWTGIPKIAYMGIIAGNTC
jgi:hypothetical protein